MTAGMSKPTRYRAALCAAVLGCFCMAGTIPAWAQDPPALAPDGQPDAPSDALLAVPKFGQFSPRGIRIESARVGSGSHPCDLTAVLRDHCDGRQSCAVDVTETLCTTRQPGLIQPIRITYRCRAYEPARSTTADPPARLRLHCGLGRGKMD